MSRFLRPAAAGLAGALVAAGLSTILVVLHAPSPIAVGVSFAVGMVVVFGLLTTEPPVKPEPSICHSCSVGVHSHDQTGYFCNHSWCLCSEVTR